MTFVSLGSYSPIIFGNTLSALPIFPCLCVIVKVQWGFPGGSDGKESACNTGDLGSIPGWGRSLEKGMATHSGILAWRIPGTEESGRLQLGFILLFHRYLGFY